VVFRGGDAQEKFVVGILGVAHLGAQEIQADVGRDAVQETGRMLHNQRLAPQQLYEDILHGVLGPGLVAQHPAATPQHHGPVTPIELFDVQGDFPSR